MIINTTLQESPGKLLRFSAKTDQAAASQATFALAIEAKDVVTHRRQPAIFLPQAPGYSRCEMPVVGAQEDVVVRHQRSAANGYHTSRGVHLDQRQQSNERAERHENRKIRKYNPLQPSLQSEQWHAKCRCPVVL